MSNTERPVIDWLRTIADPVVRESAIEQCKYPDVIAHSLGNALCKFCDWDNTNEGADYWDFISNIAAHGRLATIEPAATEWMQEVHQMD